MVILVLFFLGDLRGFLNYYMGLMFERRYEQSSGFEYGLERGFFRGGQDCRGFFDRRGFYFDFFDDFSRLDDFYFDKRFGYRLREFEGRGGLLL